MAGAGEATAALGELADVALGAGAETAGPRELAAESNIIMSSAAFPFNGRSSANLGELRRMMAGDPSHLDELYQQPQHGRGPPLAQYGYSQPAGSPHEHHRPASCRLTLNTGNIRPGSRRRPLFTATIRQDTCHV